MSRSFSMDFELVPEETRLWKPETAPQAIVMKRIGKSDCPLTSKATKAGISMTGLAMSTPRTAPATMPRSRKTLR